MLAAGILAGAEKSMLYTIKFQLTFAQAVYILATFLVLGTAAGIIPAVKAMKIKPIEALNDK